MGETFGKSGGDPGAAWARLLSRLDVHRHDGVVVAFSGGLDSSVLLDATLAALGPSRVVAFTAVSPSLAAAELSAAREIAAELGIALREEPTDELADPGYVANAGDRCFYCKRELFAAIEKVRPRLGARRVAYGYHRDDDADDRPGLRAALEAGALRPLWDAGLGKKDLRAIAASRGRSFAHKPSFACLASRIPIGMPVSAERLRKVETVESWLRARGYGQFRARLDRDDAVRLEVAPKDVERLSAEVASEGGGELRALAAQVGITAVTVDPRGYRRAGENES